MRAEPFQPPAMRIFYQLNSICLTSKLKEEGRYNQAFLKKNTWKYYWYLTKLLNKRRFTPYADGYVRLNTAAARKILGNSKHPRTTKGQPGKSFQFADLIRCDLKRWGIIKARYQKKTGTDGAEYRILLVKVLDEHCAGGWRRWQPDHEIALRSTGEALTGVYARIQRSLSLVTVDYPAACRYVQDAFEGREALPDKLVGWRWEKNRFVNEHVRSSWRMSLDYIHEGDWHVKVDHTSTGRVYTSITSFPKRLRQFLRLNGLPLVAADVSCSQPLLFGVYLKREYPVLTPDMKQYLHLVQTGQFYPYLKQLLINQQLPFADETFKGEFFGKIFYSKEKVFGKWRSLFHDHFPNVSEAILRAKGAIRGQRAGEPERLSRKLTMLESEIMIKGVARRLYEDGIDQFVTIHDAIFTTTEPGMLDVVVATIIEEYQRHGVTPHIKKE